MTYHIALLNFEGPLDLLLQLIERSQLQITEISLAGVTEQYLAYIGQINDLHPAELNRFIELASKLIYIKSLALLPAATGPADEAELTELAEQLAEYRQYQKATAYLKSLLAQGKRSWSRPPQATMQSTEATTWLPAPPNLELELLQQAFAAALAKLPPAQPNTTLSRKVSLEEMTKRIRQVMRSGRQSHLSQLVEVAADRMEALVLFLALLELVKSGQLQVSQDNQFDDIRLLPVTPLN
ncbi:MAG TPA: segregation/condensation protein A [Candidatus Saccharimonadales bacterium]|nr:segregation/condensation protein A [Candidatus Saccharimonadales bacterium]